MQLLQLCTSAYLNDANLALQTGAIESPKTDLSLPARDQQSTINWVEFQCKDLLIRTLK